MKSNQLKILAGKIITDSKLDKNSKIQLLNFVQEGSVHQVKGMLLDGEMYFNLGDDANKMIDKRFKVKEEEFLKKFEKYISNK
jgi:hypothetical protein